jgi:hypothetical protein
MLSHSIRMMPTAKIEKRRKASNVLPLITTLLLGLNPPGDAAEDVTAPAAAAAGACATLAGLASGGSRAPQLLASFPTAGKGALYATAFTYDNAAAVIALVGCGRPELARSVADGLLAALNRDRYWHDGRLRNGYAAGPIGPGTVKLAGWWDDTEQMWVEDRSQVATDTGNMAWAMLALLAVYQGPGPSPYLTGAEQIGAWVARQLDTRGAGGFSGGTFGHEPVPESLRWKSTEHNTDLAAAFRRLAQLTGEATWTRRAVAAEQLVAAMYDASCQCFAAGTTNDGVTRNPALALDAQVWPLLAIPGAATRYAAVVSSVQQRLRSGDGYLYSAASTSPWTEGTAQVSTLLALLHRDAEAAALLAVVSRQRAPEGYYATSASSIPTGFELDTAPGKPRLYLHLPHLGATAWAALAERHYNPFTGAASLP